MQRLPPTEIIYDEQVLEMSCDGQANHRPKQHGNCDSRVSFSTAMTIRPKLAIDTISSDVQLGTHGRTSLIPAR